MRGFIILLLTTGLLVTAQPASANILCDDSPQDIGAVNWTQCSANNIVDVVEGAGSGAVKTACEALFGPEDC